MAATNSPHFRLQQLLIGGVSLLLPSLLWATVLPEERADAMYHSYDGGGIKIDGPSVLVRKNAADNLSVSAQYYVDQISSASIDVMATASPYSEERTEYNLSADYLLNKTLISGGYTNSSENDYEADTYFIGISQDFFGDLSTLSLSYSYGSDDVSKVNDPEFQADAQHKGYQLSWSQVVTKNLLLNLAYHVITDEGFLNNPYRSVRYRDLGSETGYSYEPEVYPETRTSQAAVIRGRYYLPYRAAVGFEYRRFSDTWDIEADNIELNYTHPLQQRWILDFRLRYYQQSQANFYSDLFERAEEQNFRGRDKELSDFNSITYGLGVSYEFDLDRQRWLEKGSLSLVWDRIDYDYNNFRDVTQGGPAGGEALYSYSADILRLFASIWF